ncbi:hypothetical protein Leryth_021668 [Lithospermum erythrorhizon]|nr:hypothetical protein Leryth_021668 [Lithospermum erythrorhizon]
MSWNKSNVITSNAIELDLSCSELDGSIDSNSSLFSHLRRLNLALNNLRGSQISMIWQFSQVAHSIYPITNFSVKFF